MKCESEFVIDFDSLYCNLEAGHDGHHVDTGESGSVQWRLNPAGYRMSREQAVTEAYNAVTGQDEDEWGPDKALETLYRLYDIAQQS